MYCRDQFLHDNHRIAWELWSDKQVPITWEIDPNDGVIQGPLDLCFLDGRTLHLVLKQGQIALLTSRGEQQAFFPDGAYLLAIGSNVGTTVTTILGSLATGNPVAVTVALAHLTFNIFGIAIYYPLGALPIWLATKAGSFAARSKRNSAGVVVIFLMTIILPMLYVIFS